jgi:hypothetical protein
VNWPYAERGIDVGRQFLPGSFSLAEVYQQPGTLVEEAR